MKYFQGNVIKIRGTAYLSHTLKYPQNYNLYCVGVTWLKTLWVEGDEIDRGY
jgi:hypothetical protein